MAKIYQNLYFKAINCDKNEGDLKSSSGVIMNK